MGHLLLPVPGAADERPGVGGAHCMRRYTNRDRRRIQLRRGLSSQRGAGTQGQYQHVVVHPGGAPHAFTQRQQGRCHDLGANLAQHQYRQAAACQQHLPQGLACAALSLNVGGIDTNHLAVGQRDFNKRQHGQRCTLALATDAQALHTRPGRAGQCVQQVQGGAGPQVVQGNVLGRLAFQMLLQTQGRFTGHEELDLVVGNAAANIVQPLAQVVLAVTYDLRGGVVQRRHAFGAESPRVVAGRRPRQFLIASGHVCSHRVVPPAASSMR